MSKRPNIIFCHVDQLTREAISAHGCRDVSTPNLDRIIGDGIDFLRAQSTYPVCCPNRSAWYTGRFPSENGVVVNGQPLDENIPDLGQWLSTRGYECCYGGKWHVPNRDVSQSFDYYHERHSLGEFMDDSLAQATESLLEKRSDSRPLFLNVGFMNPHDICYLDIHKQTACKLGLEKQLGDRLPALPEDYDPNRNIRFSREGSEWTPQQVALYRYYYFRMIEMVDVQIGRVYDAVFKYLEPENTVFIFSSDHGEMNGHRNWFHKNILYDPSLRVPLAVVAPGRVRPGTVNNTHIVSGVDFAATILDYAGAEMFSGMHHAHSFRKLAETGTDPDWPDCVISESFYSLGPQRSVRSGDFKSIYYLAEGRTELYNTTQDPLEQNNLFGDPRHAAVCKQHEMFKTHFEQVNPLCKTWETALRENPYRWCASNYKNKMTALWERRKLKLNEK